MNGIFSFDIFVTTYNQRIHRPLVAFPWSQQPQYASLPYLIRGDHISKVRDLDPNSKDLAETLVTVETHVPPPRQPGVTQNPQFPNIALVLR